MSGQIRFFHPFLKKNVASSNDERDQEQDEDSSGLLWVSGRKTRSNSTTPVEQVIPYSQSYLDHPGVLHEDNATATRMEPNKDKEETKTLVEWKRTYKRILMKYLARRYSESDGSILDDTSNDRLQRRQQENYFPLKSRIEIMYYACKFGFFPRESFRLDDDNDNEEEENRKFKGNREDVHAVLSSNPNKNHSSGSGDLSLVETSDVLGTQTFHLEQTTMNVSLTHGLHQRTDDTHQSRQDGIQPQSYESSFIVPCIKDLPSSTNTVSDIHLMVSNVSIPLASVVNMWRFHRFVEHREETAQEEDDEDIDNEPLVKPFPREWLDLRGPVFTNYTSVVSFEIMECHEDILEGYFERVRILSKAVFGQKTRRIRLFFYDSYAEAIENILQWAEQCMRKKKQTKNGTQLVRDRVLFKERVMISLKNVPAQCIFPCYRQDYQSYVHGKPLELEYGLLSDYCICIGGDGCIINQVSGDVKRPLRFDSEQLEARFVIKRHGNALDEFVLNRKSLSEWNEKGTLKVFKTRGGESGSSQTMELCKKLIHVKDKQKNTGEGSNDENNNRHVSNPLSMHDTADRKRKSSASHDRYIPLSELDEFYMKHANNRRKDREIDICAAVLNVGVPRLTKRNWMMNLTVFDASLQYPTLGVGNETNIPQVRLVIFSNSVENFPQIDCAGDVIVGQRILVDKYEGELQLTAFAWSKFTICRPCKEVWALYHAHDGDNEPRHPTSSDDDWIITQQHNSSSIDIELIADTWKFSQKRMSNHPNVQPKYKITLADVEQMCIDHKDGDANNSGDLTAMICNIIPYPRKEQSLSSPKGVLRIWDGIGQPCSDPLPEGVIVNPEWSMRAEPNEQDLMLLSKIVERTKKEKYEMIPQELANSRIPFEELEAPKCLCGRVTNVIIWESQHWALIQRFLSSATSEMGKFVRFRNAVIKAETVPTLHVNVNTTITPIPFSTFEIKALLLRHFLRTELNHPLNPRCALLPLSLSERIKGIHPQMDSKRFAKDGFSRLIDCISTPPLTPIKVLFYILGTKQDLKTKCLQDICVTNGKMVKYQLVLHVCDSHLDMFLNVPEVVAKNMLGISASDLIKKDKDEALSKAAYRRLCRFTSSRQIFEGTVMSVIINQHKFFVLTECPTLE